MWMRCFAGLLGGLLVVGCASSGEGGPGTGRDDGGARVDAGCSVSSCPEGMACLEGACVELPPDEDSDGIRADEDCDDADDTVGRNAERSCPGPCGDGLERCVDGEWRDCEAPVDCDCSGSETRDIPCEMCGLQGQMCVDNTWTSVGECTRQGPCSPGEMELGSACGRCGIQTRTCTDSCSWSDWSCVEDEARCNYWVLPGGAAEWRGYWLTDESIHAPGGAVRAAAPLDGVDEALVVTDSSYHVLDPACVPRVTEPCWLRSGPLSELFPEVGGDTILWINNIPEAYRGDGKQGLDLSSATTDYRYERTVATGEITHVSTGMPAAWTDPDAPDRPTVRAAFSELGNVSGWVDAMCDAPTSAVPEDYIATIDATDVAIFAPGEGCGQLHREPYATFPPFTLSGAPPLSTIGAAFFRSGLYILAEGP